MHRKVLAHLLAISDPLQKRDEYAHPSKRRYRPRCLAQKYFLFSPNRRSGLFP
jgi:hypothetical protein